MEEVAGDRVIDRRTVEDDSARFICERESAPIAGEREEVEAILLRIDLAVADRVGRLEHADARVGCKRQRRIEFPAGGDVFREAGAQSCQLSREVEIAKGPMFAQ